MGTRIDSFNEKKMSMCKSCITWKQHRVKFPKGPATKAIDNSNMVDIDICGPLNPPTDIWNQYFITFVNGKSRYTNLFIDT